MQSSLLQKKFIWMCSKKAKPLNLTDFQNYFTNTFKEQEYVAIINDRLDKFQKVWSVFDNITNT